MKQILPLIWLCAYIGLLNGEIVPTSITAITPTPIAGAAASAFTFTVTANSFATPGVDIFFNTGTETKETHTCKLLAGDVQATTATCQTSFPTAEKYTISSGTGESKVTQTFKVDVLPTIIKSMSPTSAKKSIDTKVTFTAGEGLTIATEAFQLSTAAVTADSPKALTCAKADNSKTTVCDVNLATDGNYTLYVATKSSGLVFVVSSGYLQLALGLFFTLFLF